ncbi:MAG: carboxypeptidase-like regulatory domain-containing protein, partial [Gemmatimonadales bacterium]
MQRPFSLRPLALAAAIALPGAHPLVAHAQSSDISGSVTGPHGPEAGVWVIAETSDLPTKYAKIVVTDDRGRYVLPDLPKANYSVWVRGYGLVDSPKTKATPGKIVNLTAVAAPDKKSAVQYYPAQYWYALMQMPPKSDFPGTGEQGNGISPNIHSQGEWIRNVVNTDGCTGCH